MLPAGIAAGTTFFAIVLGRSDDIGEVHRHAELSQFLVDLRAPGVRVWPIPLLTGEHHIDAMHLDGASAEPLDERGTVGAAGWARHGVGAARRGTGWARNGVSAGWAQVTGELAIERSGPEHILSTFPLLTSFLAETEGEHLDETTNGRVGRLVARLVALRCQSVGLAGLVTLVESGEVPAALVKDLSTRFDRDAGGVAAPRRHGTNDGADGDEGA